jgi:hypothetical protein
MTEYCCKCHISFGLAEKKVPIDAMRNMHKDCYEKHLRELKLRAEARELVVVHKRYG